MPFQVRQLDAGTIKTLRDRSREDLYFFAKGILGHNWFDENVHFPICELLQDYTHNTRIRLLLPRGWLKTTLCSCSYPIWRSVRDPQVRVLVCMNTFTNAVGKLSKISGIFKRHELFRALFPEILPTSECTWKEDKMVVNRKREEDAGTFEAAGTGTQVTGRHYDVIDEDDTVAPELDDLSEENALPTPEAIEQAIGWHRLISPLFVDYLTSQSLVVGTRWFIKDIHSWMKENEPWYKTYERSSLENERGESDENGVPTYPSRFPREVLDQLKRSLGPYMFSCNPGEAPILMSDFSEKPLQFVVPGDEVVGFKFYHDGRKPRLVRSTVEAIRSRKALVVQVVLASGKTIRCTADHKWLDSDFRPTARPELMYRRAEVGRKLCHLVDDVKLQPLNDASGWLSGIFDGEGSCGRHITISQSITHNPKVSFAIRRALEKFGFSYGEMQQGDALFIKGGWNERRRFLLQFKPIRSESIIKSLYISKFVQEHDTIVAIIPGEEETVYSMQTTTGNYVCWGYCSKNCLCLNKPMRLEDMVFKPSWIKYYDTPPSGLICYTTVDPAGDPEETKGKPDYNVVLTTGKDSQTGRIYVLAYDEFFGNPGELISCIFRHVRMYHPVTVGIEGEAFQKSLMYWVRERMRAENTFFMIQKILTGGQSKPLRVMGLVPVISNGVLFFKRDQKTLIDQLLAHPFGGMAHDDLKDALAMQLVLWGVTSLTGDSQMEVANNDPFSASVAMTEICNRHKEPRALVDDLFEEFPSLEPALEWVGR